MKKQLLILSLASISLFSCTKSKNSSTTPVTSQQVVTDFVNKITLPQYQNLQDKATVLNTAVATLNTTPNAANLAAAQQAWKDTRTAWETCEGFLIGPVEDDNYDPNMDTWPMDVHALDSVMGANSSFSATTVAGLDQSLRGFHPLEFILWGQSGNATADSITTKQKSYMVALAQDILSTVTQLNSSWTTSGGDYQALVLNAGAGSAKYATRKDAILAIVGGMSDICDEVGTSKITVPYDDHDSTETESPFSHNSLVDFANNIKGAQNVYLCTYGGVTGASVSNFVALNNISLDNTIKSQFSTAIAAINNVSGTFELAVYIPAQRAQLATAMTALATLKATLDGDLKTYVQTYVKD